MARQRIDLGFHELRDDEASINLNMIISRECYEDAPAGLRDAIWRHVEEQLQKRWPKRSQKGNGNG